MSQTSSTERIIDAGSIIIGSTVALSSFAGCLLNLVLQVAIVKACLLRSKHPVVYKYAFVTSVADFSINACLLGFLSPGILFSHVEAVPSASTILPIYFGQSMWYVKWFTLTCSAVNRYFCICQPKYNEVPGPIATWITCILGTCLSLLGGFAQYFWYSCKFHYNYAFFGMAAFGDCSSGIVNYVLEIPGAAIVSLVMAFCYLSILVQLYVNHNRVAAILQSNEAKKRHRRNVRLTVQFAFVSAWFILVSTFAQLFLKLTQSADPKAYCSLTLMLIIDCSVSALFPLLYNEDIRNSVKTICCFQRCLGNGGANAIAFITQSSGR